MCSRVLLSSGGSAFVSNCCDVDWSPDDVITPEAKVEAGVGKPKRELLPLLAAVALGPSSRKPLIYKLL